MSIHDWTRVDAGLYHHFHQRWIVALCDALNAGRLPRGFVALTDQSVKGPIPDVLTLRRKPRMSVSPGSAQGMTLATAPPRARHVETSEKALYARRADRVTIRHRHGQVVAVIEVVSPGNKSNQNAVKAFVRKSVDLMHQGTHLLVVDLFPPSKRDPQGLHDLIWTALTKKQFAPPPDKPLTVVAYRAGPVVTAYVEPLAVGDALPALPIFLTSEEYVPAPLEEAYQVSWGAFPDDFKELLEPPAGGS